MQPGLGLTVKQLKAELIKYDEDCAVYAYEGERTCLVILEHTSRRQVGIIDAPYVQAAEKLEGGEE